MLGVRLGPRIGGASSSSNGGRRGGGFGRVVHRGISDGEGFFSTALCVMTTTEIPAAAAGGRRAQQESLTKELKRWEGFQHDNIISILGHALTPCHLHIQMEFMGGGSLASVFEEFGPLESLTLKRSVTGALEGLHYLHTREPPVPHGNLKASSILTDCHFGVKLSDFGSIGDSCLTLGALPWAAPEVVQCQVDGHEGRLAADIWSFGCTIIELATAEQPWGDEATLEFLLCALGGIGSVEEGPLPQIPSDLAADGQDLARACLRRAPRQRPPVSELLEHRFVSRAD